MPKTDPLVESPYFDSISKFRFRFFDEQIIDYRFRLSINTFLAILSIFKHFKAFLSIIKHF